MLTACIRIGYTFDMTLKEWRTLQGITQAKAASMFGFTRLNYSRYERGDRAPRVSDLATIQTVTCNAVTAVDFVNTLPSMGGETQPPRVVAANE